MSSNSSKANLARIRDNQRRSRARRKEYLQELESKLRQCELQGIEASSEIQLAARRVADENRKLRALLTHNGLTEEGIDAYVHALPLQSSGVGQHGGPGASVQALEQLLSTRKCCPDGTPTASQSTAGAQTTRSESYTPDLVAWNGNRPQSRASQGSVSSSSCASPMPVVVRTSRAQSYQGHNPQLYSNSDISYGLSASVPTSYNNQIYKHTIQSNVSDQGSSQYGGYSSSLTENVNSCVFAADMITTMAGGDPRTIRDELGCGYGLDCEVDNTVVFNIMDRYSGLRSTNV